MLQYTVLASLPEPPVYWLLLGLVLEKTFSNVLGACAAPEEDETREERTEHAE
jgi:hypothetical protein